MLAEISVELGISHSLATSSALSPAESAAGVSASGVSLADVSADDTTERLCSSCGAVSRARANIIGNRCPFCQSPQLKEQPSHYQIAPQGVWPFRLEDTDALAVFKTWIASLWFRPSALRKLAQVESIKGVYVPYWTFDAHVFSQFTAERGDHYSVGYTDSQGKRRTRTETRWRWVSGSRSDFHDDVLVCGSSGLPRTLSDRFLSFRTADALPFRPEYLLGWITECYTVPLPSAHDIAQERIVEKQKELCVQSVGGDTVRNLNVQNQFSRETFKHLLLPIWICSYRYQTQNFHFYVNAQTGEIYGSAPYSWIKIFFAIVSVLTALLWFFGFTELGRQILQQMAR